MKHFTVEVRKDCKICGGPLPNSRFRTYCSPRCRNKEYSKRYRQQRNEWQRNKWGKYSADKLQCMICGKWYVQIGTHVVQRHKMTAREYREDMGLPLKRGVVPAWYRKEKGETAMENGTVENLKIGKKFWYVKDDPKAKIVTGWKGRHGQKGYEPDDHYQ
jgi:hypothetical protein